MRQSTRTIVLAIRDGHELWCSRPFCRDEGTMAMHRTYWQEEMLPRQDRMQVRLNHLRSGGRGLMKTAFWLAGAAALTLAGAAHAGDTIKIGFVSTFSGPTAVIGNDMRNSFELALDHLGRKMGGKPVEVIYEDDQQKPDIGKQKTEKLVQSDKVDFITGYIWSNVLLASLKTAVDSQTFLISANAGPSQLAGELCSPYVFSTSWQNDQTPAAMGLYMNQ